MFDNYFCTKYENIYCQYSSPLRNKALTKKLKLKKKLNKKEEEEEEEGGREGGGNTKR